MSFSEISTQYLQELRQALIDARATDQFTAELSYRPALNNYLVNLAKSINPQISSIFEPKSQAGVGRPDWRFYNSETFGVYGYVDSKELQTDEKLQVGQYIEQMQRYLTLGHKVVLTDGVEFVFFSPDGSHETHSLISKPFRLEDMDGLQINPILESKFAEFFQAEDPRRVTEDRLVKEVALRARLLSHSVLELVGLPEGAGTDELEERTIASLNELKQVIEDHHDPTLRDPKFFADFVSQVLMFGLLYAHRTLTAQDESPRERYKSILNYWEQSPAGYSSKTLSPFRAVFNLLSDELSSLSALGTWYVDCAMLLAFVRLDEGQQTEPDYHRLFENFLEAYDPKLRFDFGAFYTPKRLARYMVRLIKEIISQEYPRIKLYGSENKLIDPGCGTGTFLEELLLNAENKEGFPRLIGFEILPAPYALAHYRMNLIGADFPHKEKIEIILTNTLSDELEELDTEIAEANLIQTELSRAKKLAIPPLTLVIGNPPSSDSSPRSEGDNFEIIEGLLEDFRPPPEDRTSRQNTQKQITNEFMKFLRWSTNKLLQSRPGFLAFVLPSSFNEHPSYVYARKWLAENFSKLWTLDLDLDSRSGVRSTSIFNTLQGRSLLLAFTGFEENQETLGRYFYCSIAHMSADEKAEWLSNEYNIREYQDVYAELALSSDAFAFRPTPEFDEKLYSHFWPVYPEKSRPAEGESFIFERHCSAIKLAPSSIFVHVKEAVLFRKMRDIGTETVPVDQLFARWFNGQDRPPPRDKFTSAVRSEIGNRVSRNGQGKIRSYSYRPLLNLKVFFSESVLQILARTGGSGTRYRPELISAFNKPETKGIAIAPAPKDIGETIHRFATFCWYLPDNDLSKRGNARIMCNLYPEYKASREWDSTPRSNLSAVLLQRISETYGGKISLDELIYYVYAVLCSDAYLDKFEGALLSVADAVKRPRCPITADPEYFRQISEIGKRLAELEKNPEEIDITLISDAFPGFLDLFEAPFELVKFAVDTDHERIDLFDNQAVRIELSPIPREILEFKISGYQVVQQWLKVHSHRYSRTTFDDVQFGELISLLNRISGQIELIESLNPLIEDVISGDPPLISAA